MRIIAGSAGGRSLMGPRGSGTRPMPDRVREALFSTLGARVHQAGVLDLYAGTGSLGLEALSRGATAAVFVEKARSAIGVLRHNVSTVGLGGEVVAGEVERYLKTCRTRFDLVFVDPPYDLSLASVSEVLRKLPPLLEDGATVVVHRRTGEEPPQAPAPLLPVDDRGYGDSRLWIFRKEA